MRISGIVAAILLVEEVGRRRINIKKVDVLVNASRCNGETYKSFPSNAVECFVRKLSSSKGLKARRIREAVKNYLADFFR